MRHVLARREFAEAAIIDLARDKPGKRPARSPRSMKKQPARLARGAQSSAFCLPRLVLMRLQRCGKSGKSIPKGSLMPSRFYPPWAARLANTLVATASAILPVL